MRFKKLSRLELLILWVFSLTLISVSFCEEISSAEFPTKPLQIVITFPPGGSNDTTARIVVTKVPDHLGQPIVVVNKPGGGGVIGTHGVLSAPADGYTILGASAPNMTAPFLMKDVRYNLLRNFTPINLAVGSPMVLVVKGDAPWQTLDQFIDEARKKPGKLNYAVPAYGSTAHFTGELFKLSTKTDITCIPREGTGQVIPAVLGGHVHAFFPEVGIMQKYLEAGSLRALAVTSKKRHKDLPNVPTMAEKGFPDVETFSWQAYLVRTETPKEIIDKLGIAFNKGLKDSELIGTFEKMGFLVENYGPKEAAEYLKKDEEVKLKVIKNAKMVQ
jgi:tripartite-type tricarboxylate transporter receptor subunit TctC